jgi:hypothetical protein
MNAKLSVTLRQTKFVVMEIAVQRTVYVAMMELAAGRDKPVV